MRASSRLASSLLASLLAILLLCYSRNSSSSSFNLLLALDVVLDNNLESLGIIVLSLDIRFSNNLAKDKDLESSTLDISFNNNLVALDLGITLCSLQRAT